MKSIISLLAVSLLVTGCLTTRSDLQGGTQQKSEIDVIREEKTQGLMRLTQIEEQLRSMNGRMEVLESQAQNQGATRGEAINNESFMRLEEKFDILRKAVDELDRKVSGKKSGSVSNKKALKSVKALPLKKTPDVKKKASMASIKSTPFDRAEGHLKNNNFIKAIDGYQKYRELNPNGLRYDRATYNIGIAFSKMGFHDEAKVFFEEVSRDGKDSSLAKMAKAHLN